MFIEQTMNGLALGVVYALVAVGYSLVFGILRILNLAHSAFYALGANLILVFVSIQFGIQYALILSVIITGLVAMSFDRYLLSPLRNRGGSSIMSLITAIGFSYVIQNLLVAFLGSQRRPFPNVLDFGPVVIFGHRFQSSQLMLLFISLILLVILSLIVYKTKIGTGMRATQQNPKAASLMGINVRNITTFTFFISGVYAAIAGFLVAGYYEMVYPTMGVAVGTKAFAAAVLGGIGVLYGSIVGGLVVGLAECYVVALVGGGYRDAIAFVILIIVLLIRPNGLFGKKDIVKV